MAFPERNLEIEQRISTTYSEFVKRATREVQHEAHAGSRMHTSDQSKDERTRKDTREKENAKYENRVPIANRYSRLTRRETTKLTMN